MNDYIKREDAIEQARRNWTGEGDWIASTEINLLKNLPSADVIEVVRCKDCKQIKEEHFNIMPDGFSCKLSGLMVEPEHYCSYGERADA